jgi:hypothetical protein
MPNVAAIRSVGSSLAAYLNNAYRASVFPPNVAKPSCTFSLASIGGIRAQSVPASDTTARVLIFLYRVSINQHLRNVGRMTNTGVRPVPLSVDLHYLLSFWAASGENEQLALAWTMRQLHETPVMDASVLSREAAWAAEDVVQLIPEEISNEDMMRIWDSLEPHYRLSLSYIARVVRIEPDTTIEQPDVVATRFAIEVPTAD